MKRTFDIVVTILALLVLILPMVLIAFIVRLNMGGPVLFRQERTGYLGKTFEIFKFRTMSDERDHNGQLLSDEERLTPFGYFLRRTSLDELPELWNVLIGDMSLVGPRPLLVEYLPLYSDEQFRRHNLRPGLTGLAQIRGRNSINWDEKFRLDIWYIDNNSILGDIRILLSTLVIVLKQEGINAKNNVSMTKFTGVDSRDLN